MPCLRERYSASCPPLSLPSYKPRKQQSVSGKDRILPRKRKKNVVSIHWITHYRGKSKCNFWYQNDVLEESNQCLHPCCSLQNTFHFLAFSFGAREERARGCWVHSCSRCHETPRHSAVGSFFLKHPDCASISRHSHRFLELQLGITQHTSNGAGGWDLCGLR